MTAMNKQQWRMHLRALHEGRNARDEQSAALCFHIVASQAFQSARVIGGYVPLAREADIRPVLQAALQQGKKLALPLCQKAPVMTMRHVSSLEELEAGAYGILEPPETAPLVLAEELDLLLVPLEGIDQYGYRLGKGGGYYDHFLMDNDVMTIGCALSWQWTESLPREPWDRPLKACADKDGLHVFCE